MKLGVWCAERRVGTLEHDVETNRFAFAYAAEWLALTDAFPLSPSLPFHPPAQTADTHSAVVRQFFENLLPEGQALDDAARAYAVSKSNVVGLLAALGRETAGAFALRPEDTAAEATPAVRRPLPTTELSERIRQRAQQPFSVWDGKVRLSIAGFQDKLAVLIDRDQWYLVEGDDLASTHIVKPEPLNPRLAGLTSNEFFCMRLAAAVKLPVAEVRLQQVPEQVLVVTRFDREYAGDRIRRLPAIDGCQALGLSAAYKAERPYGHQPAVAGIRDGASLPRLFALANTLATPVAERLRLLRWAIFQVLIGNTDAHAKNLMFMQGTGGLTLARAYDLVCCTLYAEHLDDHFAMAIGDAFQSAEISALEWATLCLRAKLPPALVRKELRQMAQGLRQQMAAVRHEVLTEGAQASIVGAVAALIDAECVRQATLAEHIPAVYRSEQAALH